MILLGERETALQHAHDQISWQLKQTQNHLAFVQASGSSELDQLRGRAVALGTRIVLVAFLVFDCDVGFGVRLALNVLFSSSFSFFLFLSLLDLILACGVNPTCRSRSGILDLNSPTRHHASGSSCTPQG